MERHLPKLGNISLLTTKIELLEALIIRDGTLMVEVFILQNLHRSCGLLTLLEKKKQSGRWKFEGPIRFSLLQWQLHWCSLKTQMLLASAGMVVSPYCANCDVFMEVELHIFQAVALRQSFGSFLFHRFMRELYLANLDQVLVELELGEQFGFHYSGF